MHPALLIKASAGTGKTFELSNRFIELLVLGEAPDKILATTFTKKAAGEIAQRIFSRLAMGAQSPKNAQELSNQLSLDLSQKDFAQTLSKLVMAQHRLNICTLDSFFIKIGLSFAMELGLRPLWQVSNELQDREILIQSLGQLYKNSELTNLNQIISGILSGKSKSEVNKKISSELSQIHQVFCQTKEENWMTLASYLQSNTALDLEKILAEINLIEIPKTQKGVPNKSWQNSINKDIEKLKNQQYLKILDSGLAAAILEGKEDFYKYPISESVYQIYQSIIQPISNALLKKLHQQNLATYKLLELYDLEYNKLRDQRGLLSFNDVKQRLYKAQIAAELDQLYFRLDSKIKHIMFDEFQDTALIEWVVLQPIVAEILSKASGEYSFFCVGDIKQAIYAWRGGVAEIFDSLQKKWPILFLQTKQESYRSSKVILDFVNLVFENISTYSSLEKHQHASLEWQARFQAHQTKRLELSGHVVAHAVNETSTFDYAAQLIKDFINKAGENYTIGVLVQSNENISQVVNALQSVGVQASQEGASSLIKYPIVQLFCSLFQLLDHPADQVAQFHLLNSKLVNYLEIEDLTKLDQNLQNLRYMLQKSGFAGFLQDLLTKIRPELNSNEISVLEQLVELAIVYDTQAYQPRYVCFNDFVEKQKVAKQISAQVQVMTMHKSKGLEFDCVVLPDLDFKLDQPSRNILQCFYQDRASTPTYVSRIPKKDLVRLDPTLSEIYAQNLEQEVKESLSLFYVALTRAKQALHLVFDAYEQAKRNKASFANIVKDALGIEHKDASAVFYQSGDSNWYNKRIVQTATANLSEKSDHNFVINLNPADKSRGLNRKIASEHQHSIHDQLKLLDLSSVSRGKFIHSLLQQVEWIENFDLDKIDAHSIAINCGVSQESDLVIEFKEMLNAPNLSKLLKQQNAQVFTEYPFSIILDGNLVTGSFDRLVISDDLIEVIDFKTDRIKQNQVAQRAENYKNQMQIYAQAAAKIFACPLEKITIKLVFVSIDQIVSL